MFNKNLIKEAHRIAREIKREYPKVNYKFQFGLNVKYLLSKVEGVEKVMVELVGSEKQIKWGNDIKKNIGNVLNGAINMELPEKPKFARQKEATKKFADSLELETSASKLIDLFNTDCYSRDAATIAFNMKNDMNYIGEKFGLDEKEIFAVQGLLQKYYHKNR